MAVNLSSIRDLLLPGLRGVTGDYPMIPKQWDKVFDKGKSDMTVERTVQMRFLGLAQAKNEGQATPMDNGAGQRWVYNQEHTEIALGYAITRKSVDDNLYKKQFRPSNLGLNDSFAQTKEILGANVFNNGATYQTAIGGDGKALFATDHPIDGGTNANRPTTDLELNESALQSALLQIRGFKNQAGLKVMARGRKLVIPPALEYVAARLLKTELRPGTADNDVNATLVTGGVPDGYVVMDFLTSSTGWFVLTDKPGLLYLERVPYETDMQVDFTTDNLLVKAYERYSFGYFDPLAGWGTFPTN
jgi:hypothetical protein